MTHCIRRKSKLGHIRNSPQNQYEGDAMPSSSVAVGAANATTQRSSSETHVRSLAVSLSEPAQAPVTQQAAPARPTAAEPDLLRGAWSVQVGAYNSADAAHQQLQRVTGFSLALNAAQPAARAATRSRQERLASGGKAAVTGLELSQLESRNRRQRPAEGRQSSAGTKRRSASSRLPEAGARAASSPRRGRSASTSSADLGDTQCVRRVSL